MISKNRKNAVVIYAGMSLCLMAVTVSSILFGSVDIPLSSLVAVFQDSLGLTPAAEVIAGHRYIILELLLPRALFALFIGSALSVSGAMMQGLFRNPLADPGLLGVSSGAALGAASVIV